MSECFTYLQTTLEDLGEFGIVIDFILIAGTISCDASWRFFKLSMALLSRKEGRSEIFKLTYQYLSSTKSEICRMLPDLHQMIDLCFLEKPLMARSSHLTWTGRHESEIAY